MGSPFFAEGADLLLEGPCVVRLLEKLPIRLGDRGRPHESFEVEVLHRLVAFAFPDSIAHPRSIHACVDHDLRDVDISRPEFSRGALRNDAESALRSRERSVADSAAETGGSAGKYKRAATRLTLH